MKRRNPPDVSTNPETSTGSSPSGKATRQGTRGWLLAACLGVLMFTACSTTPELGEGAAAKLQDRVAAARQLTAEQNFPAALAEVQQLGQDVTTAAGQGLMSQDRKTRIEAAISTIKADLEAAMAPVAPAPSPPAPATDPPADDKEKEEDAKKETERQKDEDKGND